MKRNEREVEEYQCETEAPSAVAFGDRTKEYLYADWQKYVRKSIQEHEIAKLKTYLIFKTTGEVKINLKPWFSGSKCILKFEFDSVGGNFNCATFFDANIKYVPIFLSMPWQWQLRGLGPAACALLQLCNRLLSFDFFKIILNLSIICVHVVIILELVTLGMI